jgi:hypothetical protein
MTKIFDLNFEIDGDNIRLEQDAGIGEVHTVDLHLCQLRLLAERTGLLSPVPVVAWPRGFKQRLMRLQASVDYLADDCWQDEIVKRLGEGLAYRAGMYAALDTINDLLLDAGIAPDPDNGQEPAPSPINASPLPGCLPSITKAAGGLSEPSLFD